MPYPFSVIAGVLLYVQSHLLMEILEILLRCVLAWLVGYWEFHTFWSSGPVHTIYSILQINPA